MNKYVLGISCYFHDSSVSLIKNGKIISAVQEERFTGIKGDSSFPSRSIEWCLNTNNLKISDINYIVFYEKPLKKFLRILNSSIEYFPKSRSFFVSQMKRWLSEKIWTKTNIVKKLKFSSDKILFCQHHLSHASSIYYTNNLSHSCIMVNDGIGEDQSFSIWSGEKNKIKLLDEILFPQSLGLFYSTMTSFLGHQINEGENKVMSMSAYGNNSFDNKLNKVISISDKKIFNQNMDYFEYQFSLYNNFSNKLTNLLGNPRSPNSEFLNKDLVLSNDKSEKYAQIAYSTQKITEDIIERQSNHAYEIFPSDNICLSGGVHLNCKANNESFKNSKFKNIYINFCPSDSGGSIGASLWAWNNVIEKNENILNQDVYLGPSFDNDFIEETLKDLKINYTKFNTSKELLSDASNYLLKNKIICWFQGKLEFGKRALGNRSILARPDNKKLSQKINNEIKNRESFQPFASSVLYEKAEEYFDIDSKFKNSYKYMSVVAYDNKKNTNKLSGVLHVDNSCRIQLVEETDNSLYYNLIKNFFDLSSIPLLLNTSLNLKGEPIVDNPIKAISTFLRSNCDLMYIGNFKIYKND